MSHGWEMTGWELDRVGKGRVGIFRGETAGWETAWYRLAMLALPNRTYTPLLDISADVLVFLNSRGGSRIFERGGGGPGADTRFFTSTPPRTLPVWRHPQDPPLHLRSTSKKGGGSNFGPNVKKPTSWPKRGGGGPDPLDPPPPRIRHWTRSPSAYLHNRAGRWNNR